MAGDSTELVEKIEELRSSIDDIAKALDWVYDRADEDDDPAEICDMINEHRWVALYDLLGLVDRIEEVVE